MSPNPDPTEMSKSQSSVTDIGAMVEEYSEEYDNLNTTLDELDTCLNNLESHNDDLYTRLQALLESNRQTRQELEQLHGKDTKQKSESSPSASAPKDAQMDIAKTLLERMNSELLGPESLTNIEGSLLGMLESTGTLEEDLKSQKDVQPQSEASHTSQNSSGNTESEISSDPDSKSNIDTEQQS